MVMLCLKGLLCEAQLIEYLIIEKYYLEIKNCVDEILIRGASIHDGPRDGNSLMEGFSDGGYLIWLEAHLQKL